MKEVMGSAEPEDAQKWISATEAAAMLQLGRDHFVAMAKKRGYTRWQARRNTMSFFLRKEIESWADFRSLRRKWLAKYPGPGGEKRYKEKLDLETARRLFIPSEEAAALLGVSRVTVYGMARTGRLVCYQTAPRHNGSRLWFSRRAVMQLVEDSERLKRREIYQKRSQKGAGGNPKKINQARSPSKNIPKKRTNGKTGGRTPRRRSITNIHAATYRKASWRTYLAQEQADKTLVLPGLRSGTADFAAGAGQSAGGTAGYSRSRFRRQSAARPRRSRTRAAKAAAGTPAIRQPVSIGCGRARAKMGLRRREFDAGVLYAR